MMKTMMKKQRKDSTKYLINEKTKRRKREDHKREAVAFWNQTDPDFIGIENRK